jgi:hypothetical protein
MNGKLCDAPADGGNARGLIRYLRQYMQSAKDISPERQAAFDQALTAEAMSRDDLGVGEIWIPEVGGDRCAALLIEGVSSFVGVEPEIDMLGALATRNGVEEPMIHCVFSFDSIESQKLTRVEKMQAAREALIEMGLGEHAKYMTLHIDKPHHHIHAAVAAVHPKTLLAWERNRDRFRISHACRTVEIVHGYKHDHGLYMARAHPGQATTIELATVAERMAWKAERQQDRLEERVRRTLGDYATFENPRTWQESVVARLHEHADKYRNAGVEPFWADAHLLAAEWNGRLRNDDAGAIHLDLWERIPEAEIVPRHVVDEHGEDVEIPGLEMRPTGVSLPIARDDLPFAGEFIDFDAAEVDFEQRVRADPTIVGRVLTDVEGRGMWSRNDVDAFVHRRHSDVVTATDFSRQCDRTRSDDRDGRSRSGAPDVRPTRATSARAARRRSGRTHGREGRTLYRTRIRSRHAAFRAKRWLHVDARAAQTRAQYRCQPIRMGKRRSGIGQDDFDARNQGAR